MQPAQKPHYEVVFHPIAIGVGLGNRGALTEISIRYPTLEVAILRRDGPPPGDGYVAVKIVDNTGKICRERTTGQHIATNGSVW